MHKIHVNPCKTLFKKKIISNQIFTPKPHRYLHYKWVGACSVTFLYQLCMYVVNLKKNAWDFLFAEVSKRGIEYSLFIPVLYQNAGIMTTLLCASEVVLVIHSGYSQI